MLGHAQAFNIRRLTESQSHKSEGTSLNQVSRGLKYAIANGLIGSGHTAVDYGGGKYDKGKAHVESSVNGASLHVHDLFNRSDEHNAGVQSSHAGKADYVGLHNVLNVIKEPAARAHALMAVKSFMKPTGSTAHITVYEGDKSGRARQSKIDKGKGSSWQNHAATQSYMKEVGETFPSDTHDVIRKGRHIMVRQK